MLENPLLRGAPERAIFVAGAIAARLHADGLTCEPEADDDGVVTGDLLITFGNGSTVGALVGGRRYRLTITEEP